jgi:hypothetical protein
MLEYIYFVKCPDCEDEHFDFFNEAKAFAIGCLTKKPIITQVEVDRNDFGECVDSCDLGTVWSWEEMMQTNDEPAKSIFTKDDLACDNCDKEFDELDNSLSEATEQELKTWICWYDNLEIGTVEAYTEDEAVDKMLDEYSEEYLFDSFDHDFGVSLADEGYLEESVIRKPVPEGMTIEQLVEEMEVNEDTVECTNCEELFPKEDCVRDEARGWLCGNCKEAVSVTEAIDPRELVELNYPELTATVYGNKRDVDDWDEFEHTDSHVFLVPKVEVTTAIWENWITDEDVTDVDGGLEALEDDAAWEEFLETHFDTLFEKYNKQILEYFKEEAEEDFRERSQEEYELSKLPDPDRAYAEWRDSRLFGESKEQKSFLEEFDEPEAKPVDCPECGASNTFDLATGYCSECGFIV